MIDRIGIRARIAGGSVVIAALIALVAGLIINAQIEAIVRDGTTDVLESDASSFVTALREEPASGFDDPGDDQLVAVITPSGSAPVMTLPRSLRKQLSSITKKDGSRLVQAGSASYVVRSVPFHAANGTYYVVTARSADSETNVLNRMRALLVGGLAGIVLAIAVTAWVLTGASLAPVRRLRATAERLSTSGSSELLPVSPARDDISALAQTLNGLIERLRDAADRERQLVSDASHELRTPVAILRAQLEVATATTTDLDALRRDLVPVERSVDRLSRLVVSLLELSRIESTSAGAVAVAATTLVEEVDEAVERVGYQLDDGLRIDLRRTRSSAATDARYGISTEDIGRVVENLVGNAVRAVGDRGEVEIATTVTADHLSIAVSDSGPGMSEEFLPHALERFRREDEARARDGGVGLGLPIVAAIVRRAGGDIRLENRRGSGLVVTVSVPAVRGDVGDEGASGS